MSGVQIKVSEVLGYLKAGKTRAEIAEIYGLNGVQLKALFKNPKLKNKKTVKEKGVPFTLIDDVEEEVVQAAEASQESSAGNSEAAEIAEQAVEQAAEESEAPVEQAAEEQAAEDDDEPLWSQP